MAMLNNQMVYIYNGKKHKPIHELIFPDLEVKS